MLWLMLEEGLEVLMVLNRLQVMVVISTKQLEAMAKVLVSIFLPGWQQVRALALLELARQQGRASEVLVPCLHGFLLGW